MAKTKPINPRGFDCVNVLMQKVIKKVCTRARGRIQSAERHRLNRDHNLQKMREYHKNHMDEDLQRCKNYRQTHHEERNENDRKRRKEDPIFQLTEKCRSALSQFMRRGGGTKAGSTASFVGCSVSELQRHLQATRPELELLQSDIDHIFPFNRFANAGESSQRQVMHYSNLQLLTSGENSDKRAKLPTKAMAARVDPRCWPDGVTMDMLPDIYPGWATPLRMHVHGSGGASCSTDPQ